MTINFAMLLTEEAPAINEQTDTQELIATNA